MGRRRTGAMCDAKHKESVRKRDDYKCVECKMTHNEHVKKYGTCLEVHRLIPGINYECTQWCVTLCRYCHTKMPRDCNGLIFRNLAYPCIKGVFGLIFPSYGVKAKAMKRDLIAFEKEMQRKYGKDAHCSFFGDRHSRNHYIKQVMAKLKTLADISA